MQYTSRLVNLDLVIYISRARIVIDHIVSFKSVLLELFIGNLILKVLKPIRGQEAKPGTCHHTLPAIPTDLGEFLSKIF